MRSRGLLPPPSATLLLAIAALLSGLVPAVPPGELSAQPAEDGASYDVLIRGGRVLDGTGSPPIDADVAIRGGEIAAVGDLDGADARRVLDARGLVVAPGFIDGHTHTAAGLADSALSSARPWLAQGVTTVLVNPDGGGPADLEAQRAALEEHGLGVNVFQLVPYGGVRSSVMGEEDRAPTAAERSDLAARVQEGMEAGAVGLSTGLFYPPGAYAETDEIVDAARVAARYGGVYQSHVRDEGGYSVGVLAANRELIRVARQAGLPAVHTHIKAFGPREWGLADELVGQIEGARAAGLRVFADLYPYRAAGGSVAGILVPRSMLTGGVDAFRDRVRSDPAVREQAVAGIRASVELEGGADRIQLRRVPTDSALVGLTLAEAAERRGADPAELALELLMEGEAGFVTFGMEEGDIRVFLRQPWTMVASDGALVAEDEGMPHPRGYGSFARVLDTYVRQEDLLPLEEAVRRMTSLYREAYPIGDRGLLAEGMKADVVVLDPERVRAPADYLSPRRLAEGVVHLLVNGEPAIVDGAFTGVRAGRVLDRAPTGPSSTAAAPSTTADRTRPGASDPTARVDSVFAAFDDTRSPGCAVGVRRDGETLLARGYGMADLEQRVPIGPRTVFRIGSVSKQVTAATVQLLAADGVLSLDDSVREWLPELPALYEPVTLRQMIHHTSGVRDYLTLMRLAGVRDEDYYTDDEVLAMLARQRELNFEPGTDHLYSNSGYFLLGEVVAAASGSSLRAFAAKRIFGPLGMERSHFHDRSDHLVPGRATGYAPIDDATGPDGTPGPGSELLYRRSATTLPMVGDGGVFTSVEDFLRWTDELLSPSLLGPDFLERMTRRGLLVSGDTLAYASGLVVGRYRGLRRVGHGGAFVGYRAGMVLFPEQRFAAVALCNRADADPMRRLGAVARIYLAGEMAPRSDTAAAGGAEPEETGRREEAGGGTESAPGDLERYAGVYYSPELDVTYRLAVVDGRLHLRVGNRLDGPLEPAGDGTFERASVTLRFPSVAGDAADGFELDAGRVTGIDFERVEDASEK